MSIGMLQGSNLKEQGHGPSEQEIDTKNSWQALNLKKQNKGKYCETGAMKWNRISENMYSPKISYLIPPTSAKLLKQGRVFLKDDKKKGLKYSVNTRGGKEDIFQLVLADKLRSHLLSVSTLIKTGSLFSF